MQRVDHPTKAHRVHGPECIAVMVRENFYHACPSKPLERLGVHMCVAGLRRIERLADDLPHGFGKGLHDTARVAYPLQWFGVRERDHNYTL